MVSAASNQGGREPSPTSPGKRDLPRSFVEDHRRRRVLGTVAELAHEWGIGEVTATRICQLARMARNTFYDLFPGVSGCLEYAFAEAYEQLFEPVREAREQSGSWLDGVSGAVGAFFTAIAEEPLLAELCLVHSVGAAKEAEGCDYQAAVEEMTEVMRGGREAGRAACGEAYRDPPAETEQFLARAVVSLAAIRVRQEGAAEVLPEHRDELVMLAASAFFGTETAWSMWRGQETVRLTQPGVEQPDPQQDSG